MQRLTIAALWITGLCAPLALAQPMALPEGHPPLPAGHPPIKQGAATQPAGQALPPGHPPLGEAGGGAGSATTAKLTIRAVQGTAGGAAIANEQVVVNWHQTTGPALRFETRLNEQGVATLENLPLLAAAQPQVTIVHAGVPHEVLGNVMTHVAPHQEIQVPVFETSEQAPPWTVRTWHVMIDPAPEGLHVLHMLKVENPSDRTWIGEEGRDGERQTLALPLPANAKDVQPKEGFHTCCIKIIDGKLINTMAVLPGASQYQYSYLIPAAKNQASMAWTAPAQAAHMMVFVSGEGTQISSAGLGEVQTMNSGKGPVRFLQAKDVSPAQAMTLTIAGLPDPPATAGKSVAPKAVAAMGTAVLLFAGLGTLLLKGPARRKDKPVTN